MTQLSYSLIVVSRISDIVLKITAEISNWLSTKLIIDCLDLDGTTLRITIL